MRLHLGDKLVRRRLVRLMEDYLVATNPPVSPTEDEIRAEFELRQDELRTEPRLTIEHLGFPPSWTEEGEVASVVARIHEEGLSPEEVRGLNSSIRLGRLNDSTPDELMRFLGSDVVDGLMASNPEAGRWYGPVRSSQGLHYVWVEDLTPSRPQSLDEARPLLQRDLESRARSTALEEAVELLRQNFDVRT